MTYADLKPGDVLIRNDRPMYLVVRCDEKSNKFAWMPLNGERAGHLIEPDLARVELWDMNIPGFTTILHFDV